MEPTPETAMAPPSSMSATPVGLQNDVATTVRSPLALTLGTIAAPRKWDASTLAANPTNPNVIINTSPRIRFIFASPF